MAAQRKSNDGQVGFLTTGQDIPYNTPNDGNAAIDGV